MKSYHQLKEDFFDFAKSEATGKTAEIKINPNLDEWVEILDNMKMARFTIDRDYNIYAWNASALIHIEAWQAIRNSKASFEDVIGGKGTVRQDNVLLGAKTDRANEELRDIIDNGLLKPPYPAEYNLMGPVGF